MLGRCSGHAPLLVVARVAEGLADLHLLLLLLFFVELDGNRPDGYFLVYVFHRFYITLLFIYSFYQCGRLGYTGDGADPNPLPAFDKG